MTIETASTSIRRSPRMHPTRPPRRTSLARLRLPLAAALLLAGLAAVSLTSPVNHDEDQYIGAAMQAVHGWPFFDFLYLQTPLQPPLAAMVVLAVPGHAFVGLRLAGALLALVALAATYVTARRLGATEHRARLSTLMLAACHAFLFATGIVRNDILPAALLAIAMALSIPALRQCRWNGYVWPASGFLLGAAASAKVSYAFPAAALGGLLCWIVVRRRGKGWPALLLFVAGGLAGSLPILAAWAAAPEAFVYGVFDYARTAPFEWYSRNGLDWKLGWQGKLLDSALPLLAGPVLPALAIWIGAARKRSHADLAARALDVLILAGLLAALLPTPTWRQYFVPMLPPLFARISIVRGRRSITTRLAFAATIAIGLAPHLFAALEAVREGSPVLRVGREARWIGRATAQVPCGDVATLSPHLILDSGRSLDPRFANGVFFYRTGDMLPPAMIRRLNAISPATLDAGLDERPPAAIVTGYEHARRIDRRGLDQDLIGYAKRHGFGELRSPVGAATVFLRPRGGADRRAPDRCPTG